MNRRVDRPKKLAVTLFELTRQQGALLAPCSPCGPRSDSTAKASRAQTRKSTLCNTSNTHLTINGGGTNVSRPLGGAAARADGQRSVPLTLTVAAPQSSVSPPPSPQRCVSNRKISAMSPCSSPPLASPASSETLQSPSVRLEREAQDWPTSLNVFSQL